jgi:hypothetical protein
MLSSAEAFLDFSVRLAMIDCSRTYLSTQRVIQAEILELRNRIHEAPILPKNFAFCCV